MTNEPAATTYLIAEPFERALKRIRRALAERELCISSELDLSARIHRELGIRLNPLRLLYVHCPVSLLEAVALHASAAVLIPLHIAVSERGSQTEIHVLSSMDFAGSGIPEAVRLPIRRLQEEVACALQKIAMRQGVCEVRMAAMQENR